MLQRFHFEYVSSQINTCTPVKVLVVDDDALADAGIVQAVSEAVGARPGIHVHVGGGSRGGRRLRPEGTRKHITQCLMQINNTMHDRETADIS